MLKVGMTRVDITPPLGLKLHGYPHYPRNNEGHHDPLYSACMYLENNGTEVAMITLDLLYFAKRFVMQVRSRAAELCGIDGKNIMISCSHTHSGPRCFEELDNPEETTGNEQGNTETAYVEWLIEALAKQVAEAKAKAREGYFGIGTAMCGAESGVGGNRRVRGGPHDPLVSVMAVKDANDTLLGALVNYTLHPTFIHEWSNVCTADYPAYLKMEIEEKYPTMVTGFAQGCSGNQSSRYYRNGESYDEAERVGRAIGAAANEAIAKMEWKNDVALKVAISTMDIEIRSFGTEEELEAQVAHDRAIYEDLYGRYGKSTNRDEYYLWQNANLKLLGSENQLNYVKRLNATGIIPRFKEESPAELQVITFDNACVVGFPGEAFVEYGLYIKAVAGFSPVVVNECTNGCLPGYMYTPESLLTGGYETDTSVLSPTFGRKLVSRVLETVDTLK